MALDRRTRRRMVAIAVSATALLGLGIGVGVVRGSERPPQQVWVDLDPPVAMPDAVLTDTGGQPFDLRDRTAGRVTLLYFGYLNCVDVCPIDMQVLGDVMATLQPDVRDKVDVIFVTTDPARDTPPLIRKFLDHFDTSFIGLTGSPQALQDLQIAAGLPVAVVEPTNSDGGYIVGHSTLVLAFGRDGIARRAFPFGVRESDWARVLPPMVKEGAS